MAPAPTPYKQSRTEGHAPPALQIMDGPRRGSGIVRPFPGSTAPTGPDQGPERAELPRSRFDAVYTS